VLGGVVVAALVALLWQYGGSLLPDRDAASPEPSASRAPSRMPPAARGAAQPGDSPRRARFDFYLLALSLEPAFCEDGNQRISQCRALDAAAFERTPLVLHGLWPEARQPNAWPRDCDGPRLELDPGTREQLGRWMPGVREGLDRHEWRTHGRCSGLDADTYFRAAIAATRRANDALGQAIRRNAGRHMTAAGLRAAAGQSVAGFGEHLVFQCRTLRSDDPAKRRQPHLVEVRVCLDDDGPGGAPGSLLRCADVGRRDQGCGGGFTIDEP
jgi:ribonuclease T2